MKKLNPYDLSQIGRERLKNPHAIIAELKQQIESLEQQNKEAIKLEVNGPELFLIKVEANKLIKQHRASMNLETPENRVNQGDIRCILSALNHLGFSIIRGEKK